MDSLKGITLDDLFSKGTLSASQKEAFAKAGFFCWQNSSDYTDLEYETTYKEASNKNERESFDLRVSFDWADKTLIILFGSNQGFGFDDGVEMSYKSSDLNFEESLNDCIKGIEDTSELGQLKGAYQEEFGEVLSAARNLIASIAPRVDAEASPDMTM